MNSPTNIVQILAEIKKTLGTKQLLLAFFLFILFSFLYIYTAAPSVYTGDSGEFSALIEIVGLPHPTGFPLYMMLGKAFSLLVPVKDVAFRLNIFSSLLTSAGVAIMFLAFRAFGAKRFSAILAAFVLAAGNNTIWSNAGAARVYPLNFFLGSILFLAFALWLSNKSEKRLIYGYALVLGISFGAHITSVLMIIPLVYMIFYNWNDRKRISLKKLFLLLALPLIQYFFIFWADNRNPVFNWGGNIDSFQSFFHYITQRDFSFKIAEFNSSYIGQAATEIGRLFVAEFTIPFFLVALGGLFLLRRNKRIFLPLLFIIFLNVLMFILYGTVNELRVLFRYFSLSYLALSVPIAIFLQFITEKIEKNRYEFLRPLLLIFLILLALIPIKSGYANNNRHSNYIISDFAHNTMITPQKNSILLAQGDTKLFPLMYLKTIGQRDDLFFIADSLLPLDWYALELKKQYPELIPDNWTNIKGNSIADTGRKRRVAIIKKNFNHFPIYANFFHPSLLKEHDDLLLIPVGVLYKFEDKRWNNPEQLKKVNDALWSQYKLRGLEPHYRNEFLNEVTLGYAQSLYNLGLSFEDLGFKEEAIRNLRKSLEIKPSYDRAKQKLDSIGE